MLPAVSLTRASTVLEQETDLDDARRTSCHERIPKDGVHHRAQRQLLRMSTHSPTGHQDNQPRENIPLRSAIPASREPNSK